MPHTCLRRKVSTNQSLCKDKKSKKLLIKTHLQYHKKTRSTNQCANADNHYAIPIFMLHYKNT